MNFDKKNLFPALRERTVPNKKTKLPPMYAEWVTFILSVA